MSDNGIRAMLEFIVPRLVRLIMDKQNMSEDEAIKELYSSTLYSRLEEEKTKLWHLSVLTLYDLWLEEKETGYITYPEEA